MAVIADVDVPAAAVPPMVVLADVVIEMRNAKCERTTVNPNRNATRAKKATKIKT